MSVLLVFYFLERKLLTHCFEFSIYISKILFESLPRHSSKTKKPNHILDNKSEFGFYGLCRFASFSAVLLQSVLPVFYGFKIDSKWGLA